jgi:hypothetical protein
MTNQSNFRGLMAKLFQDNGHESRKGTHARKLKPCLPKMEIKTEKSGQGCDHFISHHHVLGKRMKVHFRLLQVR